MSHHVVSDPYAIAREKILNGGGPLSPARSPHKSAPAPRTSWVTPALASAVEQTGNTGTMCAYGFDLGPAQQEALAAGNLTGALGQQPFIQGFWPVMQLYLQIDRGISAANVDTRAQLVTADTVGTVGSRFEN